MTSQIRDVAPSPQAIGALKIGLCAAYPERGPGVRCLWDVWTVLEGSLDIARTLFMSYHSAMSWLEEVAASNELRVEPLRRPRSPDAQDPVDGGPEELAEALRLLEKVGDTVVKLLTTAEFALPASERLWLADPPTEQGPQPG
ncbi:MAG: hypothetical protein ACRDTE_24110 [Pseudonocardiaceae bacterium]